MAVDFTDIRKARELWEVAHNDLKRAENFVTGSFVQAMTRAETIDDLLELRPEAEKSGVSLEASSKYYKKLHKAMKQYMEYNKPLCPG